jgi:hypothetical protein
MGPDQKKKGMFRRDRVGVEVEWGGGRCLRERWPPFARELWASGASSWVLEEDERRFVEKRRRGLRVF